MKKAAEFLTAAELRQKLGVSANVLRRLLKERRFPGAYRTSQRGHWRIPVTDYEAFKESSK